MQAIYDEIKTPHEYGVVLSGSGNEGDFDSVLVDCPHVFRMPDDNCWYMTYVGHDGVGYRTGLARSKDLLHWEKLGMILDMGSSAGAWDRHNAGGYIVRDQSWGNAPTLHKHNGKYVMLYLGSSEPGYENGTIAIGLATASCISGPWEKHPDPVLTPLDNELERGAIWKIFVLPIDGHYVSFFPAGKFADAGHEWMSMAYSDDLIHWRREESNPVLKASLDQGGRAWGERQTGDCEVVRIGSTWVMVYFTDSPYGIIDSFAVSKDLVHWTESHIPLRLRNQPYNCTFAHKPCLFKHNGVVYHYYNAVATSGSKETRTIALAASRELGPMINRAADSL